MDRLPLAEIERVYVVQLKENLMIVADGFTSGSGGSLHIWKSHAKIFPPLFEIYEMSGIASPDAQAAPTKFPVVAANVFPGRYNKVQIVCANDRIFPKIIEATEEVFEPSDMVETPGKTPELNGGVEQWIAIHEFTPAGPPKLRVEGNALLPNLGVAPRLVRAESQGDDPKVLLLNVVTETLTNVQGDLRPRPVRTKVRYEEETNVPFESVQIQSIDKSIFVENVHHQTSK
jgi:hypothetical protein